MPQFPFPACVELWCGSWDVVVTQRFERPPWPGTGASAAQCCSLGLPPSRCVWGESQAEGPGSFHGLKVGAALPCEEFNLP